jgi:hypothetical protein
MYINNSTHTSGQVTSIQVFAPNGQRMLAVDNSFSRNSIIGKLALIVDEYALAIQVVNAADQLQWLFSRAMNLIEVESVIDSSDFRDIHLQLELEFTVFTSGHGETDQRVKLLLRNGARGEVI